MDADLDTLATALYVRIDDALKDDPSLAPWRPMVGIEPKLTDAELVTVAVMQALLGFTSETRWLRHASQHFADLFPYLPSQAGYNKRLRAVAGLVQTLIRMLAVDTAVWSDDTWLIDSTPVECGRSRPTAKRSDLVGWADYGGIAPPIPATSGAYAYIRSPPSLGCRWRSALIGGKRSMNAKFTRPARG